MYNISPAFAAELANDNRAYLIRLDFTFIDGHLLSVDNSAVWQGGLRFEEAVSGDSEFQIGSAIINKLNITLNNINDQFDSYVFEGANVVAYVGLELSNGTTEMVRRGTYTVNSVTGQNASLIKLECLDYMSKFDVPYEDVVTTYPASLGKIVSDICTHCSVSLRTASFDESSYVVRIRPNSDGLTCRQVLAYAAQIACAFARMDDLGRLELRWFRVGENIDPEHSFRSIYNIATSQYTVAITGIRVTEEFRETDAQKRRTELWGAEGYVLDISGNELIQSGAALAVAQMIGRKLVGSLSFKTVEATVVSDPSVEAGDTAVIIDEKGNSAFFPITRVVFETDNSMSVSCSAKTPSRQASTVYDQLTRAIIKANNYTSERLSDYDRAVMELSQLMSESFGVFMTEVVQQDGSVIRVQHNKPNLEDSDVQWKMTAGSLAVSTDYGETWNAGIDAQGNAVVNVLNAVGVSADWVRTGALSVSDKGNVVFQADLDTGAVYLSGDYVFIGDKSATEALSELAGALVITLSNEIQGIPVDSNGDYETFPDVETTIRVFYGSEDITPAVTLSESALGVTGTLSYNATTRTYVYHATSLTGDTGYVAFTATYASQVGTLTNSKRFNLYKAYAGKDGPAGTAILYMLEPNVDIVKRGADDACAPGSITFFAYYRNGDSAERYPYSGLIEVYVMRTNSTEWELVVPALANKTFETYAISDSDIVNIKATLGSHAEYDDVYWGLTDEVATTDPPVVLVDSDDTWFNTDHTINVISGGDLIDVSTVPVLTDISNLTQDKVFEILTDNTRLDGLWYLNGKAYFNASYIATGILRSKTGNTYWNLETGNLNMESGSINLGNGTFFVNSGGIMRAKNAYVEGAITASSLTLTGNATIPYGKISDTPNLTVFIEKGQKISLGPQPTDETTGGFEVSKEGLLRASNALIWGTIYATSGKFVGDIEASSLTLGPNAWINYSKITDAPDLTFYVQQDGTIGDTPADGATGFRVSKKGLLKASNAVIYGEIHASAGKIGGCSISNGVLQIKSANITGTLTGKTIEGGEIDGTKITGVTVTGSTITSATTDASGNPLVGIRLGNQQIRIFNNNATNDTAHGDKRLGGIIEPGLLTFEAGEIGDDYFPYTVAALIIRANSHLSMRLGSSEAMSLLASGALVDSNYSTRAIGSYAPSVSGRFGLFTRRLEAYGTKNRIIETEDYGARTLYSYETPSPMFGDVGEGVIGDDGVCYVKIDPTFQETISTLQYQVFLQAYGDGKCYVRERKDGYFVVAGTPEMEFGWELKGKQIDYSQLRLDRRSDEYEPEATINYGDGAIEHIQNINNERTGTAA